MSESETPWETARESLSDASESSLSLLTANEHIATPRSALTPNKKRSFGPGGIPSRSRSLRSYIGGPDLAPETRQERLAYLPVLSEQRHPGKEGARLSRFRRPFEPDIEEKNSQISVGESHELKSHNEGDGDGGAKDEASSDHLHGWPLFALITGISLAVFLVSIDRTVVTTAIPYITREFNSTESIGWYGSAYLVTSCAFQPLFGRVYLLFSAKLTYLCALLVFEAGSLVCALAQDSTTLIAGRAVSGLGSAGILTGSFVVVAMTIPLQKRPIYTAVVGIIFGVGATTGPLLGGVFTDLVNWRWCFWINLPVGALTALAFILFFKPSAKTTHKLPMASRITQLDIAGNLIFLGAAIMLFLALELATRDASWSSAQTIGLLCGFGAASALFVGWCWWRQDYALIPPGLVAQRTVAASCIMAFLIYGALLAQTYFLPIWFQAILGKSALQSGVDMIPYFVINAFFSLVAGVLVSKTGYYVPPCLAGNAIATIGCGLLTLLSQRTSTAEGVGFQILVAAGFGLSIQQGFTAVQTVLPPEKVPIGTAVVVASQSFGGAVFVSVGNSIFQSRLAAAASSNPVPGVDLREVFSSGATAFRELLSADALRTLLPVYNDALRDVFIATVPLAGAAFAVTLLLEWRSVKSP